MRIQQHRRTIGRNSYTINLKVRVFQCHVNGAAPRVLRGSVYLYLLYHTANPNPASRQCKLTLRQQRIIMATNTYWYERILINKITNHFCTPLPFVCVRQFNMSINLSAKQLRLLPPHLFQLSHKI